MTGTITLKDAAGTDLVTSEPEVFPPAQLRAMGKLLLERIHTDYPGVVWATAILTLTADPPA